MKTIFALLAALLLAGVAHAEPMATLQRTAAAAEKAAALQERTRQKLHDEALAAVQRLAKTDTAAARDALAGVEIREQAAAIGVLQTSAALRRARQALGEAVTAAIEQGDAIERAAQRAAHGEVAPGVRDRLACDGPDCATIPAREHEALVLMGAVPLDFDAAHWPPEDATPAITVLSSHPSAPRIATLHTAVRETADVADKAQARAEAAYREMVKTHTPDTLSAYGTAQAEADTARAAQTAAEENLKRAERAFADAGRALKRAALLAGDGYALARGGKKACADKTCVSAEGLEAAAFLVLGAAEDMNDGLKSLAPYVVSNATGEFVFR